jgi:hypothetical protein
VRVRESVVLQYRQGHLIYKVGETQEVRKGVCLGALTDEQKDFGVGFYIEKFVSGGSKNYSSQSFAHRREMDNEM